MQPAVIMHWLHLQQRLFIKFYQGISHAALPPASVACSAWRVDLHNRLRPRYQAWSQTDQALEDKVTVLVSVSSTFHLPCLACLKTRVLQKA